jgi:cell division protein FtsB
MPFTDPDMRLADFFLYGVLTGISLVIVATILMWRAARWEIDQVTGRILEELGESQRELAEQLRKYQAENEFLKEELHRLRDGTAA